MKKFLPTLFLIAASAALQAVTLADFSNGPGRTIFRATGFSAPFKVTYIDDAIAAAPAKAAKIVIPEKKAEAKFSRFDLIFKLKEGEAAATKAIEFDVKVSDPAMVNWITYYIFGVKWDYPHLLGPSGTWRNVKAGEWKHFKIATARFMPLRGEITLEEGRQLCISFFCKGTAGTIEVANIKLLEK